MSKKILYECMKCGKTFIEKDIDGLSCCKCKKALRPLGDADEIKEYIATMQDKLEKADRSYSKTKSDNTITIKLVLDTTEFNNKLHEVGERLEYIKVLETAIQFDKVLKKVRDIVDNTDLNELKDRAERLAIGAEHIKDNRYTIEPQELSKLMKETLTKATEALSLMTKDLMNRSNNNG
ncbi:non-transporter ABC protein [Clostridium botulinum]|uniref:non-transporter ABC protein n=1 Tax=Clostridium botulinum TaxID=1491 RepID=UPI000AF2764F|nr:non-transporter ABC protein [Clostridium botulinum]